MVSDRAALAAAISLYRDRTFVILESSPELVTIIEAAERQLALIPQPCHHGWTGQHQAPFDELPSVCLGKQYPAETVQLIGEALRPYGHEGASIAVLDALNEIKAVV